jgi:septum formation protein
MSAPQKTRLILASTSVTRAVMLRQAGIAFDAVPARVDEEAMRAALVAEGASPSDQADALAETKAVKVAQRNPAAMVLGADQILSLDGRVFAKPGTKAEAVVQLTELAGQTHHLWSAAVVCINSKPVWRHVSEARLTMHALSRDEIAGYVEREWSVIRHSVGAYRIEEAGIRLMARIEGDHFTILGLPMIPLLTWLRLRGDITA